jgi:ubiquitin carboxyl-terminal hydrolase 7
LVHIGDVHGGHYCAFLRPKPDSKWFKFDDDMVTPVAVRDVLESNYGGNSRYKTLASAADREDRYKRVTSAYMLVYIRDQDRSRILSPVEDCDIPTYLRTSFFN